MRRWLSVLLFVIVATGSARAADIIALVTKVEGEVVLAGTQNQPLSEPFIKLRTGDILRLGSASSAVSLIFFDSGRQENWKGAGSIKLDPAQSQAAVGSPALAVKQLPANVVRQLARTPAPDTDGKVGMMRLRSIPTPEALEKLEKAYKDMQSAAAPGDREPDLYWLSGLFELRDFDRLEGELKRLTQANADNMEMKVLNKLYARAIIEAKRASN